MIPNPRHSKTNPPTFADLAIRFNLNLNFSYPLPENIRVMNPFNKTDAKQLSSEFYQKFYADFKTRKLILGINPGRHGAGLTGIPFTDSDKLLNYCGINPRGIKTRELSAEFIYKLIQSMGGVKQFYSEFYINSPSPLGYLIHNSKGNWVNANYYDNKAIIIATEKFITQSLSQLCKLPISSDKVFCLGSGKNYQMLTKINQKNNWFVEIIPLEHPRYIMQYKSKQIDDYITKFKQLLTE